MTFYESLPFNYNERLEIAAKLISESNNIEGINPNAEDFYYIDNVLEIGCGAGWLSNSIACYYGTDVTAVDFNPVAIKAAKKTAQLLGVDVDFQCADLFALDCEPKDMVISVGVLHHTFDCRGGVRKCIELTKNKGKIFLGLYHKYGRKPFLDYFARIKEVNCNEDFLFEKYRELDRRYSDEIQSKSRFLDQVLHPYETQHTLKEIVDIFKEMGVKLVGTSINQFEKIDDLETLYAMEKKLYEVGMRYIEQQIYYPGFFMY